MLPNNCEMPDLSSLSRAASAGAFLIHPLGGGWSFGFSNFNASLANDRWAATRRDFAAIRGLSFELLQSAKQILSASARSLVCANVNTFARDS
jgi:hypothetical protein